MEPTNPIYENYELVKQGYESLVNFEGSKQEKKSVEKSLKTQIKKLNKEIKKLKKQSKETDDIASKVIEIQVIKNQLVEFTKQADSNISNKITKLTTTLTTLDNALQIAEQIEFKELNKKNPEELRAYIMRRVGFESPLLLTFNGEIDRLKEGLKDTPSLLKALTGAPLFSSAEIKKGRLIGGDPLPGSKSLVELLSKKTKPSQVIEVNKKQIDDMLVEVRAIRHWQLLHLEEVYNQIKGDSQEQVRSKFFPPTHYWVVGETASALFAQEMAEVGGKHGIKVISSSTKDDFVNMNNTLSLSLDRANQSASNKAKKFVPPGEKITFSYPQDFIEFFEHECRVQYVPDEGMLTTAELHAAIVQDRKERSPSLWEKTYKLNPPFAEIQPSIRRGWNTKQGISGIAMATALDLPVSMQLTYSEGGNALSGYDLDGNFFVIIGHDSIAATKALLKRELGRSVEEQELKQVFAIDYGVNEEFIYFVEQPASFHLDMSMAIAGPKKVILNDAVQSNQVFEGEVKKNLKLQEYTEEKIEQIINVSKEIAENDKLFEDQTEADLVDCGFKVVRVPGKFSYPSASGYPETESMNFFNMVTAKVGEVCLVVTTGVINKEYEAMFGNMIKNNFDITPNAIYFLDLKASQASLLQHAGISCSTKII